MTLPEIGDEIIANIWIGDGIEKPCLVEVMGFTPTHVRVKMIDPAEEVGLSIGDQTLLPWDRFPSLGE